MRSQFVGVAAAALFLMPQPSNAQVYMDRTPAPTVNAARASWQVNGEPLFYAGGFYYPAGPTEFFDGQVMARTGTYDGTPLYENRTLEPYSIVFVPVSGGLMRPYERRRSGMLGGTIGSRTPSFPVQHDSEQSLRQSEPVPTPFRASAGRARWDWPSPGARTAQPALMSVTTRQAPSASPAVVIREVPRRESTNAGAFIEFEGLRHYTSGKAVRNDAQRFVRAGELRGAAVFRESRGDRRTVFVEVVPGGALAPYSRR